MKLRLVVTNLFTRGTPRPCGPINPSRNNTLSQIVTVATAVRDPVAVASTCRRFGLAEPAHGTVKLFEGEATGLPVALPGWLYPCVCDLTAGTLKYDHYGGAWGDPARLDRFLQTIASPKSATTYRAET
jgi:hypothetical protein